MKDFVTWYSSTMKKSVVIITHNEALSIKKCIQSILEQTIPADEIVVVVHNSTDNTLNIVKSFSDPTIIIDDYRGPSGIIHARLRGIAQATGDVIFCIDGDTFAQKNWIETLNKNLENTHVSLAGSSVVVSGTFFWMIGSPLNRLFGYLDSNKTGWVWGASFAFRSKHKEQVLQFLEDSIQVTKILGMNRNPDDYWLALNMQTLGQVAYTTKTKVFAKSKQLTTRECFARNRSDVANGKKMLGYFKKIKNLT